MDRGNLGSYTLANVIRCLVSLSFIDSIQELIDNAKDYTRRVKNANIIIATQENETHIRLLIFDNGISMKPMTIFKASMNQMQRSGSDSIGYFHKGALTSFLSLTPNKIFEYTKEPNNSEMYMTIYKPNGMIETTKTMFKEGYCGKEISNILTSDYIKGPFMNNDPDQGITKQHLDNSLNHFKEINNIESYMKGTHQGTAFVFQFEKGKTDINSDSIYSYFKTLCYKRKNNETICYYKNGVLQENVICKNNPFENNIVNSIDFTCNIETNEVYLKENEKFYKATNNRGNIEFTEVTETNGATQNFSVNYSIVSKDQDKHQEELLNSNDVKKRTFPIIETDDCYLGFPGKTRIPEEYCNRTNFGSYEPLCFRCSIYIPSNSHELLQIFGVNGEKDEPRMNKKTQIVSIVLDTICKVKKYSEQKVCIHLNKSERNSIYRKDTDYANYNLVDNEDFVDIKTRFDSNGLNNETSKFLTRDEVMDFVLFRKQISPSIKGSWKEICINPFIQNYNNGPDSESESEAESEPQTEFNSGTEHESQDESGVEAEVEPIHFVNNVAPNTVIQDIHSEATVPQESITETVQNQINNVLMEPINVQHVNAHERVTYPDISQKDKMVAILRLCEKIKNSNLIEKASTTKEKDNDFHKIISRLEEEVDALLPASIFAQV